MAGGYRAVVVARNLAYDRGWKTSHAVEIPTVSIGNLTLGGTGKTPMVEWVARWYRDKGRRVAILSRGYGRSQSVNDEALVLEQNLPDVPHLQGADRVRLAQIAIEELQAEVAVLDDAFQHRRLKRDLDIVLLDALDPFGLGRIFPRGLLREPVSGLRRAQFAIITRADMVTTPELDRIRSEIAAIAPGLAVATARHAPAGFVTFDAPDQPSPPTEWTRAAAFCGIGNPEGFRRSLQRAGSNLNLLDLRVFPDHHEYTEADVVELAQWAKSLGAEVILTTQKDLVKVPLRQLGSIPLRALRVKIEFLDGLDRFEAVLGGLR